MVSGATYDVTGGDSASYTAWRMMRKKPAPNLIRGDRRFSEQIMLH
jgi:hypothetical protein